MASLAQLYREAKEAGFSPSEIRGKSAAEVTELLAGNGGGKKSPAKKKAVVKKAKAEKKTATKKRGRGRPKGSKNKTTTETVTKKKRGRPAGSKNKSTKTRPSAKRNGESTNGRHILSGVNYSKTDGWNPREGSAPDRIVKALKKFKGDREKVFEFLKSDIWDFMGKTKRNGQKRSKSEAEEMLRYRIARTDWQFGIQTGQHEIATDRAEYGTAGTGSGTFKPAKKSAVKKSGGKRGRPKGSGKTQKASKKSSSNNLPDVSDWSDQKLKRYVKSFEGKRGRRPAEYHAAEKELAKR